MTMKFIYTNYKGETEERDVDVTSIDFLPPPGVGYDPGWFLTGIDKARNAKRSFRIDARMVPIPGSAPIPGGNFSFPISDGNEVRASVQKIEDIVSGELAAAGLPQQADPK